MPIKVATNFAFVVIENFFIFEALFKEGRRFTD